MMAKQSAFKRDARGPWAEQDPQADWDWTFDFADPDLGPALEDGELIASVVSLDLYRDDGQAITTEEKHSQTNTSTRASCYVRKLIVGVVYWLDVVVRSDAAPPRDYPRRFRIVCKEM